MVGGYEGGYSAHSLGRKEVNRTADETGAVLRFVVHGVGVVVSLVASLGPL